MKKLILFFSMLLYSLNTWSVTEAQLRNIYPNLRIKMVSDPKVYAQTNGVIVYVNRLAASSWNMHEAAFILGHEMGHRKVGWWETPHQREYKADYYGSVYARNAGYSPCKGIQVARTWKQIVSSSHPHPMDRIKRICGQK